MCNLYSQTKSQDELKRAFRFVTDRTGNMPPMPSIFRDSPAPVVRFDGDELVLEKMRWGFASPKVGKSGKPVQPDLYSNCRNPKLGFWKPALAIEQRCLVPFTSFSEPQVGTSKPATIVWFAAGPDRPVAAFAGIWRRWHGMRKHAEGEMDHQEFAFLTTDPNDVVAPVHPKAMPVVLEPDQYETWLRAPVAEAIALQRPARDGLLQIVASGPGLTSDPG